MNKKKIGIITLHRARNFGSILQAYALQEYINNQGYETVIYDYYPERYHTMGLLKRLRSKSSKFKNPILLFFAKLLIFPSYMKKKFTLDKFVNKNLDLSRRKYKDSASFNEGFEKADAYCTGSDQVWNSHWNELVEPCLFLNFAPKNSYKFSYAASFGKSHLDKEEESITKDLLESYTKLGIRETSGVKICENLGLEATQVLDPTLLLDAEEWNKLIKDKYKGKKYILTYNLHHDKKIENYAKKLSKEKQLPVYNITYNIHDIVRYGHVKWCPSLEVFLSLFKNAEFVVADSFHATVYSIIYKKQFLTFLPEHANSRIIDFLDSIDLSNKYIKYGSTVINDVDLIDYHKVDENLNKLIKNSTDFIVQILKEIEGDNNEKD